MKYAVRVARLTYGDIEVEANDREDAKKKAMSLENYANINWIIHSDDIECKYLRIAEVEELANEM